MAELGVLLIAAPLYCGVLIAVVALGVVLGNAASACLAPQLAQLRRRAWARWRRRNAEPARGALALPASLSDSEPAAPATGRSAPALPH